MSLHVKFRILLVVTFVFIVWVTLMVIPVSWKNHYSSRFGRDNVSVLQDVERRPIEKPTGFQYCPNITRPKRVINNKLGHWQINKDGEKSCMVYSAYFDDRPTIGNRSVIRVLGVSTGIHEFFCQLWYDEYKVPLVSPVQITTVEMLNVNIKGVEYRHHMLSCSVPQHIQRPNYVSLAFQKCGGSTIHLPIVIPEKGDWTVEFGVCVSTAYGFIQSDRFVEWMEFNQLMGVEETHIYDALVDEDIEPIFLYYQKKQSLFVHPLPPPVLDSTKDRARLSRSISLNDCMLRNMYRYRYIIILDFDENIVPRNITNYHDMVEQLVHVHNQREAGAIYTFRNTYHFTSFNPDTSYPRYLQMLRYRQHAPPSDPTWNPKSMIDPRRCLWTFNHYCVKQFPGIPRWFDAGTSVALSHHYRKTCHEQMNEDQCNYIKSNSAEDNVILNYKHALTNAVMVTRKELGLET